MRRPRLLSMLFADWGSKSEDSKIALGGIFDRVILQPKRPPVVPFFIYLRTAETYSDVVHLVVYAPDGDPQGELQLDCRELKPVPGEPSYVQAISQVAMEMPQTGVWWFDVRYQGQSLGLVPLFVTSQEESHGDPDTG